MRRGKTLATPPGRPRPPTEAPPTPLRPRPPAGLPSQLEGECRGSSYFNNSFIEIQFTCHPGRLLKESASVASACSQICATITTIGFGTFSPTQKRDPCSLAVTPLPAKLPAPGNTTPSTCRLACSGRFAPTESRSVWSFASDLFYSAQCFWPSLSAQFC